MPTVSVLNTTAQVSGKTLAVLENDQTITGAWTFSGNATFNGNVAVGNAASDTLTITSTIVSHLLFTDNTYDIGASGATRPRDLFLARNATIGGTLAVTGATTLTDDLAVNGGDLTTSATTFNLVNATVTTLNLGSAATTIQFGATTGTCTIRNAILSIPGGQIAFPATQVASADANTLDDYEENTWTPVLTFATAGDLSVVYSTQTGSYTKVGRKVTITCNLITSTFTHTTASGNLRVTGFPFTVAAADRPVGPVFWAGITKASYTNINVEGVSSNTFGEFSASGSGQGATNVAAADCPTGGTMRLNFTLTYFV